MATSYNQIAGRSVERLAALSDGVFAVAMTLLVLDLRAPAVEAIHNEGDLWLALGALAPRLIMCATTFHDARDFLGRPADPTEPLDPFGPQPFMDAHPVCVRGFHDAVLHHAVGRVCAQGLGLVRDDISPAVARAIKPRIVIGQGLYAFGALLCLVNTYVSIGFIVLIQLNYAIAPRLPGRRVRQ
jgi:hypothetical protein